MSFTPCREGYASFRLVLKVKRRFEPLALTVKADCFTMSASVQVEMPGEGLKLIKPNHQDTLDFGKVSTSTVYQQMFKCTPLHIKFIHKSCLCLYIHYWQVEISEQSIFNFLLTNLARFCLEVNFELTGPSELLQHLEAQPQNATAEVGRQLQLSLSFCPQSICNLEDVRLSIKVKCSPRLPKV